MSDFYNTVGGRQFIDKTIPRLIRVLERLADKLDETTLCTEKDTVGIEETAILTKEDLSEELVKEIETKAILQFIDDLAEQIPEVKKALIAFLFNEAENDLVNETDFYSDVIERGYSVEDVRFALGDEVANHMLKHCEEHGVL